jgi:hypothetical protein
VGSRSFVEMVKEFLGTRAQGYQLREAPAYYKPLFKDENEDIGLENIYFWNHKGE